MQEQITQTLDKILKDNLLGSNFQFRTDQRETVEAICQAYFQDPNGTVVIDAPTGAGKSIIAIASSLVLIELGKKGYIITSDLSLQDQYESDLHRLKLQWGSIKGVDNYECAVNGLPFSLGDCRLKGMSYEKAKELSCYSDCGYLTARDVAINSRISLLNYAFWLIQRNYVEDKKAEEGGSPFQERDFVFFDEAHKIDEIVQNHFSPKISKSILVTVRLLDKFLLRYGFSRHHIPKDKLEKLFYILSTSSNKTELLIAMEELKKFFEIYLTISKDVKATSKKRYSDSSVPKDWQSAFGSFDRIKDMHCKFDDYIEILKQVGVDKMVPNQTDEEVEFTCIEEQWLIKKHLHERSAFKVFMSATIGDPVSYMKIMGIDNAKFVRLSNDFNYDKSPIIFVNKYKLSMREKTANLPHVVEIMDKIISKHKGQRGVIHCGSYEFMNYIMSKSKHTFRLINYENSKEKASTLELFKKKEGAVLVGPSILEGLDLKDDMSRFQIFFKVPYPSLGSPHIKAKMNQVPGWYDWKTTVSFLQGVGRSVRSKDDWAVTYVLDACFKNLLNKIPPNVKDRIKTLR
jgi:Rad3-related DNA helicase